MSEFDFSGLEEAVKKMGVPSIGPQEGKFVYFLARLSGAKKALELGTGVGYSSAWLARAVGPDGNVITIERDQQRAKTAQRLLREINLTWVKVVRGDALKLVEGINSRFDLIFVDILRGLDEHQGSHLARAIVGKVRLRGIIVADNAEAPVGGARAFVSHIARRSDFEHTVVPYREGVQVALKVGRKIPNKRCTFLNRIGGPSLA